jgi:hypothetical protein
MTFGKVGLAAVVVAAFIGLSGTASQAVPFSPKPALTRDGGVVQVQYRNGDRRFGPPRRVCRWETVTKRVRGRIVRDRVERCRVVRR